MALTIVLCVVARPARAQLPSGTGAIAGQVLSADDRPLRAAHVLLIGAATGTLRVTSSDGDGRFTFAGLPSDRYTVGASKPPFLGAVAGARRPARPGAPVVLADGQRIDNISIRLYPGASISGVITDEHGVPAHAVRIQLQQWRTEPAGRVLADAASTVTDERGRYRLHSRVPGEYVVAAVRGGPVRAARPLTSQEIDAAIATGRAPVETVDPRAMYAHVFYPGTPRPADAVSIVLDAGDDRQSVDFRLELVSATRLEGTVMTSDGQPAGGTRVVLSTVWNEARPMSAIGMIALVRPDGRFEFPHVPPGSYSLIATGTAALQGQFASEVVEIAGTDRATVQMTMRPPLTLPARLVLDGTSPPPLAGHRVPVRGLDARGGGAAAPEVRPTDAAGAFTIGRVLPGRYLIGGPIFFGATTASVHWALQSVVVDGRDVTDLPLDVSAEKPPKEIVLAYGDVWQQITGRLTTAAGAPAGEYVVVLFPADRAYWIHGSRRIATARPAPDGAFSFGGPGPTSIPPGEYRLAVVPDLGPNEQYDPALLAQLSGASVRVSLGRGEKQVQDLRVK